jgi:hypothetical protein
MRVADMSRLVRGSGGVNSPGASRSATGSARSAGRRTPAWPVILAILAGGVLALLVLSHHGRAGYNAAVLADHPVAFWDMSGTGSETDLTGNNNTGIYDGGQPGIARLPDGARAVDFNGQSEYMTVPSNRSFSITHTGRLTFEAWIRPNYLQWNSTSDRSGEGFVNFMGKCAHYAGSCEWGARMYASANKQGRCNRISAYAFNPSAGLGVGAGWQPVCGLLRSGQWLYVVGEYQTRYTPADCNRAYTGSVAIWVNGVRLVNYRSNGCMSQYGVRPEAGNSPLTIGTMAMDSWFPGAVGKAAIYDSLLSQAEISAHFKAMTGKAPSGSCSRAGCAIPVPTT